MKKIFPVEIAEHTTESYFIKRNITSKIIYTAIILVLLTLIVLLPFIKVDLSAQSRGIVRSVYENNTLQSVVSAQIQKLNLYENLPVKEGDTLIWLNTEGIDEQINRLYAKQEENSLFISDIDRLLHGKSASSAKYKSEYSHFSSKLNEQKIVVSRSENEYTISRKLYEKGVEPRFEYDQNEKQYQIAKSQLAILRKNFMNTWESERTGLEIENRDLESQIKRLEKDKSQYFILAPICGNIVQYAGVKEGNYITAGQTLAQIASSDNLLVECYISPTDIGYIRKGQEVNIQMDAFDYRQWGLLRGKVTEIVSDILSIDNQPFFKVKCSINRNYLELKNGYRGFLIKGMTLTGRFTLTERSLAQLLFDRVDNWMNPKIMDNGNQD